MTHPQSEIKGKFAVRPNKNNRNLIPVGGFCFGNHKIKFFGFTLIELMVVVSIMLIIATFLSINIAGTRNSRDLTIAQTELVTNLRKVESYTLSSRNLPSGQSVEYYVMKFDLSQPDRYFIQAMYNVMSTPTLVDVETIKFPTGVKLLPSNPISIDRPGILSTQNPSGCAIVAFKLPYGKVFANNGCSGATNIATNDDYDKILNFQSNIESNTSGTGSTPSTDSIIVFNLVDRTGNLTKTVTLSGVTGTVIFQ